MNPSAIILTPIHQSYGFTYDVTNDFTPNVNIEVIIRAFRSTSQVADYTDALLKVFNYIYDHNYYCNYKYVIVVITNLNG